MLGEADQGFSPFSLEAVALSQEQSRAGCLHHNFLAGCPSLLKFQSFMSFQWVATWGVGPPQVDMVPLFSPLTLRNSAMLEKYFWLASATFFSAACGFTISRPCKGVGER